MTENEKLLRRILAGESDANAAFHSLRRLLRWHGFQETVRGSHHVFRRAGVPEKTNLQADGGKAKVSQIRQVRKVLRELTGETDV